MRNSKLALALFLIFVLSSTVMVVRTQPLTKAVVIPILKNAVTLDGVLGVSEWSDAVELPVTFRFYNQSSGKYVENRTGFIYLKHNCADLWLCILMEDPTENVTIWASYPSGLPSTMGDSLWIFYAVSGDMDVGAGDDEKGMLHPNFTYDGAIIPGPGYDHDINLGGTKDINGASCWAESWLTIEMVHPLNSGDSDGNDPHLNPGDEIFVHFIAMDPEIDTILQGTAFVEEGAYIFKLIITPCVVGGEIFSINYRELTALFLLVIVAAFAGAVVTIYKRRVK